MKDNLIQVGISFVGGLCCLLPLLCQASNYEGLRLRSELSSTMYRDSAMMIIALVIPIALDTLADIVDFFSRKKLRLHKTGTFFNTNERIVFLCGMLVCPLTVLLSDDTHDLAFIYVCTNKSRLMMSYGVLVASLCRYKKEYWSIRNTYIMLFLMGAGSICGAFFNNMYIKDVTDTKGIPEKIVWLAFCGILTAGFIFFGCSARWLFVVVYPKVKIFSLTEPHERVKVPDNSYFPLIFNVAAVLSVILIIFLHGYYWGLHTHKSNALFLNNMAYIFYLIAFYFVMIRMVKYEVMQGLYALIDSKKSYVRYISHELRTPLNAASLGLKLLTDEIETSSDPKDIDRYSTLCDVNLACRTAVDILNDLLCFDKIESGVLEVHKHEVSLLPFIKDCVGMFSAQAREGGVNLSIVSCIDEEHHIHHKELPLHSPLRESDTVSMDKFKMDQVLRNLVSNALKFTPRGGSVSVSAVFVPNKDGINHSKLSSVSRMMKFTGSTKVLDLVQDLEAAIRPENGIPHNHIDETHNNSTVFVPKKWSLSPRDSIRKGEKAKAATSNFMMRRRTHLMVDSSKEANVDNRQDLEAGTRPENGIAENEGDMEHGKLLIVVRDSGVGMSEENQKRLFHEVVQFNPEVLQAGGGSGLGLWITNNIVNMHDGKVSVYSAGENMGSSFSVEIDMKRKKSSYQRENPAQIEITRANTQIERTRTNTLQAFLLPSEIEESTLKSGATTKGTIEEERLKSPSVGKRKLSVASSKSVGGADSLGVRFKESGDVSIKTLNAAREHLSLPIQAAEEELPFPFQPSYKILMVDDSALNRKLLGKLLRGKGHIVEEAEDGLQAVEMVETRKESIDEEYDIILMDFVMPKMDGPSATKAIRASGYTSPIFGVTGNALDSDVAHFLGHGADRVMIKPFNLQLFTQNMTEMQKDVTKKDKNPSRPEKEEKQKNVAVKSSL